MLDGLLTIAALTVLLIILAAVGSAITVKIYAARERRRVACEVAFADWQLRQLARAAMKRMLDEARQSRM